jgi:hypothetical protein
MPVTMAVGAKGGVSVYGLGRFPVTLYREQWERLAASMPEILAFIQANAARLKVKESKPARVSDGPPYDAATRTGMYDREDG